MVNQSEADRNFYSFYVQVDTYECCFLTKMSRTAADILSNIVYSTVIWSLSFPFVLDSVKFLLQVDTLFINVYTRLRIKLNTVYSAVALFSPTRLFY